MGNLFGKSRPKPKKPEVTEQDKAILQLKQQRDSVKKYQKRILQDIEKEREIARQLLKDNKKDKALLLLKKKKFMESILEKTDNQLMNLERLMADLEFSQIETKVVEGLQIGNDSLKQLHSIFSIEKIEEIMDDTKEGVAKQREIDDLLMGYNVDTNEEDLNAELEQMLGQTVAEEVPAMPEVPQNEPEAVAAQTSEPVAQKAPKPKKEALLES